MHGWRDAPTAADELWRMEVMSKLIPTVPFKHAVNSLNVVKEAEVMMARETPYDKDGIVIAANHSLVENVKFPETKIAFKFNKQIAQTFIKWIEWNVSRTAKIIPLVYINPVELGGVTIGKCTAFNAKFVKDKGLGLAATIKVCRSGDVIPYIEEVINTSDLVDIPTSCPVCDSPVKWDDTGVHIQCTNLKCPPIIRKKIAHFFLQLGLEFFSEKGISSLGCNCITDVYKLQEKDILKLDGWGEKSAKDFVKRIQDTKQTTPDKLLASLGIHGFGGTLSKLMLDNFTFEQLVGLSTDSSAIEKLCKIKGVATKRAQTLVVGLRESKDLLQELATLGVNTKIQEGGTLSGLKFELTGTLSRPRKEVINWIEMNGGRHTSLGSANYLICNEVSSSSKYKKAVESGKEIITEEQMVNLHFNNKKK
jgi:DNA ligase (NAD+)